MNPLAIAIQEPSNNQGNEKNVRSIVVVEYVVGKHAERLYEDQAADHNPGGVEAPSAKSRRGVGAQEQAPGGRGKKEAIRSGIKKLT